MGRPDALSRRPNHGSGSDNQDVTLLTPGLFQIRVIEGVVVAGPQVPLLRHIRDALAGEPDLEDPVALAARELLKARNLRSARSADDVGTRAAVGMMESLD